MRSKSYAIQDVLKAEDIRTLRKNLEMTQKQFADFVGVSNKTIERWEKGEDEIGGPITVLYRVLMEMPDLPERLRIPEKTAPLRLYYMYRREVCTIIDVNERKRTVAIKNFTKRAQFRAFGVNTEPSYEDYEEFMESRCFPRSRDKMKLLLKELGLPFYDPLLIIEKTEGRMEEDEFWIRIERM
ncbi:MAG: helix-turn-helix domain-containing protein [Lachnospiraceae bacterium]|nr:helix-turn-helix domain-containing protein [Lachnospiraceae bacterium]